jgi:hypothetical protein
MRVSTAAVAAWIIGLLVCGGIGGLIAIQFNAEWGWFGVLGGALVFAGCAIWLGPAFRD